MVTISKHPYTNAYISCRLRATNTAPCNNRGNSHMIIITIVEGTGIVTHTHGRATLALLIGDNWLRMAFDECQVV